ncbi:diguanylate cyclase domain-containing protein [Undibacterium sp.]|uniref:diguanylate cyclase domain-containing protein n=1 Tax=Undibacterium sp. TaxID=1914977 RepID=UPI002BC9519E|nr:diguanylate cyclase [Undibacterium sp.]HTD02554.1 diguanylate cyclase [Undibacterium sp.]
MQRISLNLPLARKFLGFNIIAIMASMLTALAGFLSLSALVAQQHLHSEAVFQAGTLAANLGPALVDKDISSAQSQILNASNHPRLLSVKVIDSQGHGFVSWSALNQFTGAAGAEPVPVPVNNVLQTAWGIGQLSVITPILLESKVVGTLQLDASVLPLYKELLALLSLGLALIAPVLAIACYQLTKKQIDALAPMHELCSVSEQVFGLHDYSVRITNDDKHEFSLLIQHFNQMLARIDAWDSNEESAIRTQREQEQRIDILDNHDSLTKLPNRHYFHRVLVHNLDEAVETGELAALMFIDLDNFKSINDEFGYEGGNFVLSTIAGRLSNTLRGTDTVCRIGGDEFAAILPQVGSVELAETLAGRLMAAIGLPIALYGKNLTVSASIGIACFPSHAQEQRPLLRNGDIALAAAKAGGKNTYRTYTAA